MFKRLFRKLIEEVKKALISLGKAYIEEYKKDNNNPLKW